MPKSYSDLSLWTTLNGHQPNNLHTSPLSGAPTTLFAPQDQASSSPLPLVLATPVLPHPVNRRRHYHSYFLVHGHSPIVTILTTTTTTAVIVMHYSTGFPLALDRAWSQSPCPGSLPSSPDSGLPTLCRWTNSKL